MDNTHIKANSDYAFNYTEHLVKRETDGKLIGARIAIILLSVILFFGVLFLMFGPVKIPHIAVVAVVLICYVAITLWGLTSIEYEYVIASGEMSMDKIIAAKKRKRMAEFKIPEAEQIIPFDEARLDGANVIYGMSSLSADDLYCAIYKSENGERTALVFNATEKALNMLRYYNKACVIRKK